MKKLLLTIKTIIELYTQPDSVLIAAIAEMDARKQLLNDRQQLIERYSKKM